jgi:phosphopantothenoylcysteine synthetase/decarboxylase
MASSRRSRSGRSPLEGRKVLLGLSGSIAVYKSCELVRRLTDEGAQVFCLMTAGAQRFVSPLTFGALSGNPVATDIWDASLWKMAHLESADQADLYLIAPASTNTLARLAGGFTDDVVAAAASATRAPVLLAPAMHDTMWLHPATQANVRTLKSYGYRFVGPEKGPLLRGGHGWGRLAEIPAILDQARKLLDRSR